MDQQLNRQGGFQTKIESGVPFYKKPLFWIGISCAFIMMTVAISWWFISGIKDAAEFEGLRYENTEKN